jgi:hypothetical protein
LFQSNSQMDALPPPQPDEPEWLQVQRTRRRQANNLNFGGLLAMGVGSVPYAIAEAIADAPHFGRLSPWVLGLAAILTVGALISRSRFDRGSFARSFASWSVATHGLVASVALITLLQGL